MAAATAVESKNAHSELSAAPPARPNRWPGGPSALAVAAIAFVTLISGVLYLDWSEGQRHAAERRSTLRNELVHVRSVLGRELDQTVGESRSLASWVAIDPNLDATAFDRYSRRLLDRHPVLRSTMLVPDNKIARTYPPMPELIGLDVEHHPVQGPSVLEMMRRGEPILTGPIPLPQGGSGFALRAPVWLETSDGHPTYWGHVSLIFDLARIEAVLEEFSRPIPLDLLLRDFDRSGPTAALCIGPPQLARALDTESLLFEMAGERWVIYARSKAPPLTFPSNWIGVIAGFALALAFSVASFLLLTSSARLRLQNQLLRQLATRDTLTGAFNRRVTLEACNRELARALRSGSPFSVVIFDLDHFKLVNDRYGHQVGDAVLCTVTSTVSSTMRATDLLGRWGGEEFLVLAPDTTEEGAFHLAERIRRAINTCRVTTLNGPIRVTASFGVATLNSSDRSVDPLLERADQALYLSKEEGRNRTRVHDERVSERRLAARSSSRVQSVTSGTPPGQDPRVDDPAPSSRRRRDQVS